MAALTYFTIEAALLLAGLAAYWLASDRWSRWCFLIGSAFPLAGLIFIAGHAWWTA